MKYIESLCDKSIIYFVLASKIDKLKLENAKKFRIEVIDEIFLKD